MRTDGVGGYVFVNHYQRLTELDDLKDVVIDTGTVEFPAIDVKGPVSFFFPFMRKLKIAGHETMLRYATAQPLCRMGDTFFFAAIPGITAEYCFEDGKIMKAGLSRTSIEAGNGIRIVTLSFEDAQYLRKLDLNG
jgi:hypothetical protein